MARKKQTKIDKAVSRKALEIIKETGLVQRAFESGVTSKDVYKALNAKVKSGQFKTNRYRRQKLAMELKRFTSAIESGKPMNQKDEGRLEIALTSEQNDDQFIGDRIISDIEQKIEDAPAGRVLSGWPSWEWKSVLKDLVKPDPSSKIIIDVGGTVVEFTYRFLDMNSHKVNRLERMLRAAKPTDERDKEGKLRKISRYAEGSLTVENTASGKEVVFMSIQAIE